MKQLINLTHLKFFCDAVNYSSISEAAKANYVSQSAVSQAIKKIEIAFEAQLVLHTRQKFQLTEVGQIVFEQAGQLFRHIDGIYDKIHMEQKVVKGTLRFASTKSLGVSFLPSLYKQTKIRLPELSLHFTLGGRNYIRNALRQHEVEFAIVVFDPDFMQFSRIPLKKGRLQLYQNKEASSSLIENGIFVDYIQGTYLHELQEYFLSAHHSPLKIQAELSSWEAVARFTEMNLGIGFFPDYLMTENRYPNLESYPIDLPPFEYEICAIHNKEEPLSRMAMEFLNQFRTME